MRFFHALRIRIANSYRSKNNRDKGFLYSVFMKKYRNFAENYWDLVKKYCGFVKNFSGFVTTNSIFVPTNLGIAENSLKTIR